MTDTPRGRALMVVGTCSNAGKSLLVSALCRIFARRGLRVAPFKAQNMSLNSGVTPEGHEVARSICVQAEAAGIEPHVDMNPVLLKPEGARRSQVVLCGRPRGHLEASSWMERKQVFWREITRSLDRLRQRFELVICEGAGSPAEINLAAGDVANLRVAVHAEAPALLVGDIDRGGVFASLLGTMMLLPPEQRDRVGGFVINKLRGDPALIGDGPEQLRRRAFGVPTLGIVPFLPDPGLAEEDSVALEERVRRGRGRQERRDEERAEIDIAVIRLPHLANFDDFDALTQEPDVDLRFVERVEHLGEPDAVILPGTKTTLADLAWLRRSGLAAAVEERAAAGTQIVGICGGYQMLGAELRDPEGVEAEAGSRAEGLGLLPQHTAFVAEKRTRQVRALCLAGPGPLAGLQGLEARGYEIHMGHSTGPEPPALFEIDGGPATDGSFQASGQVWGTYLHGLFDNDELRHRWLEGLGWSQQGRAFDCGAAYERLADHFETHLDLAAIERLVWPEGRPEGLV